MSKLSRQVGTTSQVLLVHLQHNRSVSGSGITGLLYNSQGLQCYYKRNTATSAVAVPLVTIPTLGTYVSGGFKEVDNVNCPGLYEFHPPDAALAAGADSVIFYFTGYVNLVPRRVEIELTGWNNQIGVTPVRKNKPLNNFTFLMTDTSGVPKTGLTITATRSLDGSAFSACSNSPGEIGNGIYAINLSAGDLNGNVSCLRFTASGAADNIVTVFPQP